jgi:hypothetical protein
MRRISYYKNNKNRNDQVSPIRTDFCQLGSKVQRTKGGTVYEVNHSRRLLGMLQGVLKSDPIIPGSRKFLWLLRHFRLALLR